MDILAETVRSTIEANRKMIAHYGTRKDKMVDWFVGRTMAASGGTLNPDDIRLAVHEYLARHE